MSRECNDAFDGFAARKGYQPRTWNYIRAVKAWQEAWDAGRAALVRELEAERDSTTPGVTAVEPKGDVVVTWAGDQIVLVSRQDEEGRILSVIAEAGKPPAGVDLPDGIQKVRELTEVQKREAGTGDAYMVGLFNGLELALATIENREPKFVTTMSIELMTREFVAATKKRAHARSHLSALRKKWLADNDSFWDKYESDGMEGHNDMLEALHDREQANAEYRRAKSRLFRACAAGVLVCAVCAGTVRAGKCDTCGRVNPPTHVEDADADGVEGRKP